jgi:hypothetical protein
VLLKEAINTRNPNLYAQDIEQLKNSLVSKDALRKLLKQKEKIFYCELPSDFSSLRRDSCEKMSTIIRKQFTAQKITYREFIMQIGCFDSKLLE